MKVLGNLKRNHSSEMALFLIFILTFIVMGILSPDKFLSGNNIKTMAFQIPEFGLMSLAMMIAVLTGGINLSITTGAALSGILSAFILASDFTKEHTLLGVISAIIICLGVSVGIGALNGWIIAYVGVAPMLVTLGTKTLFEGLGLNVTKGGSISGLPDAYSFLGNGDILGIPVPIIIFTLVVILTYFLFERSGWGTKVYMIGANEQATRFSGVNTKRVLLLVYIYSGLMSGLASVFISSRYNSAKTDYGSSYLLQAVTAVVLGGTAITGGTGTVAGTVIAVLIMQVISTGLNLIGVNRYMINIATGGILIAVLALRYIGKTMEKRKMIRERRKVSEQI